ncbi:MAG: hypothetical protein ABI824_00370 [Acidobacteriota bacterium]
MRLSRFGIIGASPGRVSVLGRSVIAALVAAGAELIVWIEGDAEEPLPGDLHQPSALSPAPSVTVCSKADAAALLAKQPIDFLLQLDSGPQQIYSEPQCGVWRLATASPGPLAFWDVYDGAFCLEIRLERLLNGSQSIALERRWIQVDRLSYTRTLGRVVEEMSEMVAYVARCGPPESSDVVVFPPAHTDWPTAWETLLLQVKLGLRFAADQYRGLLFSEAWMVGVVEAPASEFLDMGYQPQIHWLPSPTQQRFLADPFLVRCPDGWLLMAEDFDFDTNLGRIVQEFSADGRFVGNVQDAIVALKPSGEPCHMSYPFLLQHAGELYCIPETHQLDGVFAWRWDAGSRTWKDRREIISGAALLDPTLVFYEDRWWMFATRKENGVDSKLHLFYADSIWGPWQPHARNPVKVDVRSSRPGGKPFVEGGRLYRPAQDSSKHYGWRSVVNMVTCLTPTEFREETIRVVDSDRLGMSGVHTLSGSEDRTLIDAWKPRLVPGRALRVLLHKIQKLAGLQSDRRS